MIRLSILGPIDLRDSAGGPVHTLLAQPKRIALLAHLASTRDGEMVRRDVVAALFWPEHDEEHARACLRTSLHGLRRALGDVIAARGIDEIGCNSELLWCDAREFRHALTEERWSDALSLYRGDFLHGVHVSDASPELERWVDQQRRHYRAAATGAAWRQSGVEESRGRFEVALDLANRAVAWNPSDEIGLRRLLQLHERMGDRAGALAAFETFASRLRDEFDTEPSAETLALVQSVRERRGRASENGVSQPEGGPVAHGPLFARWTSVAWAGGAAATAVVILLLSANEWKSRRVTVLAAAPASGELSDLAHGARGYFRMAPLPTPLSHASATYDALRDKIYVFGGRNGKTNTNDVWVMDQPGRIGNVTWTQLQPRGTAPAARFGHAAVYDSVADRLIVFGGGLGFSSPCANDTWILESPSLRAGEPAWHEVTSAGRRALPAPRGDHAAVWVPARSRLLVFGGHDCIARRMNDTWALDLRAGTQPTWRQLATGDSAPVPRSNHTMVYDASRDRVILFGGGSDSHTFGDVWELRPASVDTARWHQLRVIGPDRPALMAQTAAWDPVGQSMIVFGGVDATSGASRAVWLMSDAGPGTVRWHKVDDVRAGPTGRWSHAMAYNASLNELVVLGGESSGAVLFDAWAFMNVSDRRLAQAR